MKFHDYMGVFNVKDSDYGAIGDGVADDTDAIQAAITAAQAAGHDTGAVNSGGIVWFPPGVYKTIAPLTFSGNSSTRLRGAGRHSTAIHGNFAGYIIQKPDNGQQNLEGISGLYVKNFRNNTDSGAILADNCAQMLIDDCYIQGFTGVSMTQNIYNARISNCIITNGQGGGPPAGSVGAYISQVTINACRFEAWAKGIVAHNVGATIIGSSCESSDTAIVIGKDRALNGYPASAFSIIGFQTENVGIGLDLYEGSGGLIANNAWTGTQLGTIPAQYAIRVRGASNCVFIGNQVSMDAAVAGIDLDYGGGVTSGTNNIMIATTPGLGGWIAPSSNQRSAWRFIDCNYPYQAITFNELPGETGSVYMTAAREGMEYDISDGTNGLTWGDVCTNSGTHTTHYKVRYNGTDWTVVGK